MLPAVGDSAESPRGSTIHELIARQALLRPDSIAVTCDGLSISHGELNARANQVAHRLRKLGVAPGNLVAIGMERSIDMVVGLLAILKAGGAYLPIDPAYPKDRLDFMLSDARPVAMLTLSTSQKALPDCAAPIVLLDLEAAELALESAENPPTVANGDSLAYVIYTSGSTGKPKGCQLTHGNVVRLFSETEPWFGFNSSDVWTFFHSHAFDFSVWEIWGALAYGGSVVVVPYLISRSPRDFLDLLVRERVTVLNQTPSAFRTLIDADAASAYSSTALSLRYVIFGGEALELQMLQPWFARHGDRQPQLINMYGITETTVHVTYRPITLADLAKGNGSVIGEPIPDLKIWLLDEARTPVQAGVVGEMYISGAGVCRGYLNRAELTAERFIDWTPPQSDVPIRLYKSGDLARRLPDGDLVYLGRIDHQVKIRGFRIETGEIESELAKHPSLRANAVIARNDGPGGEARLVAYVVPLGAAVSRAELRAHLAETLPEFMIPTAFVAVDTLPLTENGKLDRKALPAPAKERPELGHPFKAPSSDVERLICKVFGEQLEFEGVGVDDNFFELGGTSLLAVQALDELAMELNRELSVATIFAYPTAAGLALQFASADVVASAASVPSARPIALGSSGQRDDPIAIIGMAGRFPGAATIEEFWEGLLAGRDSTTRFDIDALDPSIPASLRNDPDYVRARGVIDGVEDFDAAFFGMPPREAEVTDPQQRVFLELAWECLERAGYAPDRTAVPVGVFAGMGTPSYLQRNVLQHPEVIERVGELQVQLANDKDYIATRVAYKLNLKGPAVNVNTACSTSLVAIAQAVDSLRLGRCAMALAGAASVTSPPRSGYLYQDGSMLSKDAKTRTFDAGATGTVFNDGAAIVLLKRLSEALADGDQLYAVIRGIATNNDGGGKASFTAPSIEGQSAVIVAAHEDAGVDARSISYVEAHGTATPLGDPVEVEGLTRAFRRSSRATGFCRIGSVKSNVGHLVTAAGAAGLIKTALALAHEQLPATLHFDAPNPKIDFANSPFVVNNRLTPWPRSSEPRRAGLSSFGVGGTNAHAVLEEAPLLQPTAPSPGAQLLQLSAKTRSALDAMAVRLADHLDAEPAVNLADVAHTLRVGRSRFAHRMCVVADSTAHAATALRSADHPQRAVRELKASPPPLVWLFPGQGAQYPGMGSELYAHDAVFRQAFDDCMEAFRSVLPFDLKARMFDLDAGALTATDTTQPATFCIEYALAHSWLAQGARPAALIGHSVGEFTAAVLAGVMSLNDAARLVARRGALMQSMPPGSMLAVRLPLDKVLERLPVGLELAAENGPSACVVAGSHDTVKAWHGQLEAQGVVARLLQTSHAFHSPMMDGALEPFEAEVRRAVLSAPAIPIISTLTGESMTAQEATDSHYWARHLREPVRFSSALKKALALHPSAAFLEVGPRATLSALARQHVVAGRPAPLAVTSLSDSATGGVAQWLYAQGQLWTLGFEPTANNGTAPNGRRRVRLPSYPFERKRHWLDAAPTLRVSSAFVPSPVRSDETVTAPVNTSTIKPMSNQATVSQASSRRPQLMSRLRELFEDVAGADLGAGDSATSFVELGLDSLTLTQAALQVKKQFSVNITFRQLMEKYRSFDALAQFLDASLPPEPVTQVAQVAQADVPGVSQPLAATIATGVVTAARAQVAIAGAPFSTPLEGGAIQQVISQQMQLMAQQLALLGGVGASAAPVAQLVATATPIPVVAAAAAQIAVPAATTISAAPSTEDGGKVRYDVKKAFGAIARIHTQAGALTERQQSRLDAFTRRYIERTKRSKAYTVEHRSHMADPRVVNGFRPVTKEIVYQIVVERSKGSRMWDLDGNEYVDVLNGFGMNLFGWQPDFVIDAVRKQLDLGYDIGPQHPLAGEVSKLLCELTGFDRVGLCNTGSEAVMAAMRIARTVTGRDTIVLFTGSYHGTFDEVLVRAGRGAKGISAAPGVMSGMFGDVRVLDYGTTEALEFIRQNADSLAAVLVEPVQSRRPDFQPKDFLKEVRAITERNGACLIFDEVITGFRSHLGGTQALFGIRADLTCYGKVIGGGFPVGAVAGKREYMDALDGGAWEYGDDSIPSVGVTYFAGTFVRHPLALAAAKVSLEHLKRQGNELQTRLNTSTAALADELSAFCREVGAPLEIRYFSSLWRISWLQDHPLQDLLFAMMRSRGVHILDNFPCFMTTAHTPEDIAIVKSAFKESIAELQEAEFLPRRAEAPSLADASRPPVPNAKLGRDKDGRAAWFVPDANVPGKFKRVSA